MSYAPIYSKLNDLESRLTIVEASSKQTVIAPSDAPVIATKTDLPDVPVIVTKTDLPDVSGFATKADLPDVSGFATKAELPDVSGFATKAELPDVAYLYDKLEHLLNVVSQLNIKLNEANEKISALETPRI